MDTDGDHEIQQQAVTKEWADDAAVSPQTADLKPLLILYFKLSKQADSARDDIFAGNSQAP